MSIGKWKVLLTSNEIVEEDQSRVDSWRLLMERCRKDNLKIKEFYLDNVLFEKDADAYIVYYEGVVLNIFNAENTTTFRKAVGYYIQRFNKCRLNWFKFPGPTEDFPEVLKPIPQHFLEISIPCEKSGTI